MVCSEEVGMSLTVFMVQKFRAISRRQNLCNITAVEFANPAASLEYNVVFLLVSTSVCSCLVTVLAECLISKAFIYSFH